MQKVFSIQVNTDKLPTVVDSLSFTCVVLKVDAGRDIFNILGKMQNKRADFPLLF